MASRRTMITRDRQRTSLARKRTERKTLEGQQKQADQLRDIEARIRAASAEAAS